MKRPVREELSEKNLLFRGVTKKFINKTIDDFEDFGEDSLRKVKEFVRDYIENIDNMFEKNRGIIFFGSNGVGKTFLANLIVKEAYRHRYTSRRITFVDYITLYTKVWGLKNEVEKEEEEAKFYHDYKGVEFLVLEEVGKELDTKLSPVILEDCLRYREDKGLPTILCTNLTKEDLLNRYGDSIVSLISGNMIPIKIVGEDKRRKYFLEME